MPVLVPWTASTDTVKGVPIFAVLSWTIMPSRRSSSRSPSSATQMSPLACRAMKFTSSAVTFSAAMTISPSFSRSSSSMTMTIFPSLMSPRASSMALKQLIVSHPFPAW